MGDQQCGAAADQRRVAATTAPSLAASRRAVGSSSSSSGASRRNARASASAAARRWTGRARARRAGCQPVAAAPATTSPRSGGARRLPIRPRSRRRAQPDVVGQRRGEQVRRAAAPRRAGGASRRGPSWPGRCRRPAPGRGRARRSRAAGRAGCSCRRRSGRPAAIRSPGRWCRSTSRSAVVRAYATVTFSKHDHAGPRRRGVGPRSPARGRRPAVREAPASSAVSPSMLAWNRLPAARSGRYASGVEQQHQQRGLPASARRPAAAGRPAPRPAPPRAWRPAPAPAPTGTRCAASAWSRPGAGRPSRVPPRPAPRARPNARSVGSPATMSRKWPPSMRQPPPLALGGGLGLPADQHAEDRDERQRDQRRSPPRSSRRTPAWPARRPAPSRRARAAAGSR